MHTGVNATAGSSDATPVSGSVYLNGHLELLVFPLQLLRFRQRAGVHHAGIQHGLAVSDPAQHLKGDTELSQKPTERGREEDFHPG